MRRKFNIRVHHLKLYGGVAQLGERLPCTQEAIGSNPFTSTRRMMSIRAKCSVRMLSTEITETVTTSSEFFDNRIGVIRRSSDSE